MAAVAHDVAANTAANEAQEQPAIVVLKRDELETYTYEQEELHADHIGIDLETEYDLLWIALAGLKAELPKPWKPCRCEDSDEIFFFNFETGASEWEHPADDHYRGVVIEERAKRVTRAMTLQQSPCENGAGTLVSAVSMAGEVTATVQVTDANTQAFNDVYDALVAQMQLPAGVVPKFVLPDSTLLGFSHFAHPVGDVLSGKVHRPVPEELPQEAQA